MTTAQKDRITRRLVHIASLLSGGGSFFTVTAAMTFPEVDPSAAFGFKLKDVFALAPGDMLGYSESAIQEAYLRYRCLTFILKSWQGLSTTPHEPRETKNEHTMTPSLLNLFFLQP
jgi:hypothetical protein